MVKPVTIIANAVKARLIDADRTAKMLVDDALSYYVEDADRTYAFKSKKWDGRRSFFEFATCTFPAGFIHRVHQALRQAGIGVILKRKPAPAPLGPDVMDAYLAVNPFGYSERYDYQVETVRRLEKYRSMVAHISTGGGKSLVSRAVAKRFMRPTLFLTTRQVLMYQMATGFEEAGFKVGVLGDGEWRPNRGINCGMVQTLAARLRAGDEFTKKLLQFFEVVIAEEAHEASGNSFYDVLQAMPNAHYRLALTATPFLKDDGEANMRLLACVGEIGIKVPEELLIDRGILATPYFKLPDVKGVDVRANMNWQKAYEHGVVANDQRNGLILFEAKRAAELRLPTITLVQRKVHGEMLKDKMRDRGIRADFIFGETSQEKRARALQKLGRGELDCLIGSTILDVGVDVPAVGMVILAAGGKAEVSHRQRIGRGLRAKKGANVAYVVDFMDKGNRHLVGHAVTRKAILDNTPGFAQRVLPSGQDFDFSLLQKSSPLV